MAAEIAAEAVRVAMKFDRASGGEVIVHEVPSTSAGRKRRKAIRVKRSR